MKALALIFGASLLFACSATENGERAAHQTAETTVEADPDESVAGRYEVTRSDGFSFISVINADGTYSEIIDGKQSVTGTWEAKDDQTCYDPEGAVEPTCYSFGAPSEPAPEGTFTATSDEGVVHLVRPIEG
jgi:hypothetical protein